MLAAGLGADPTEAGTLASATGWGNVVGCLGCAVLDPRRIGLVFTLGMLGASACLALTAVDSYIVCLLGLFFANGFGGLFGAMQATLVMQALPPVLHGSGMGTLSLAIGAQAVGGLLIGETAELVSPRQDDADLLRARSGLAAALLRCVPRLRADGRAPATAGSTIKRRVQAVCAGKMKHYALHTSPHL